MGVCVSDCWLNYSVWCALCPLIVLDVMAPVVVEHYKLSWLYHLLCMVLKPPLSPTWHFTIYNNHIYSYFTPHLSPTLTPIYSTSSLLYITFVLSWHLFAAVIKSCSPIIILAVPCNPHHFSHSAASSPPTEPAVRLPKLPVDPIDELHHQCVTWVIEPGHKVAEACKPIPC